MRDIQGYEGLYGNISSCCKGNRNTAGGYHWSLFNV